MKITKTCDRTRSWSSSRQSPTMRIGTVNTHTPSWSSTKHIASPLSHHSSRPSILRSNNDILNNTSSHLCRHYCYLRTSVITASGPAGGMNSGGPGRNQKVDTLGKKALVGIAVTYMLLIVLLPFINVFVEVLDSMLDPIHRRAVNELLFTSSFRPSRQSLLLCMYTLAQGTIQK